MYCNNCGNYNNDDSKFCSFCGVELGASTGIPMEYGNLPGRVVEMKKKKPMALWIAIGCVLAVTAVVITVVLLTKGGTGGNTYEDKMDLGRKYLSELNYEQAIIAFEEAIKIDPKRKDAYLELATVYSKEGKTEEALTVLDRALKKIKDETDLNSIRMARNEIDPGEEESEDPDGGDEGKDNPATSVPEDRPKDDTEIFASYKEYDAAKRVAGLGVSSVYRYDPNCSKYNLFNDDRYAYWGEGAWGTGEDEYIDIVFDEELYITGISMFNGFAGNENEYSSFGRIENIRIYDDEGVTDFGLKSLNWDDVKDLEYTDILAFDNPRHTKTLRIMILDAVEEEDNIYNSITCISRLGITALGDDEDRNTDTGYLSRDVEDINMDINRSLESDRTYMVDLDGDGENESIKYECSFFGVDEYAGNYVFNLIINGESAIYTTGEYSNEGAGIEFEVTISDIDPGDGYKDILYFTFVDMDGHIGSFIGYRYENKKIVRLFEDREDELESLWGNVSRNQKNDSNICLIEPINTIARGIYFRRDFRIVSGILVPIYSADNVYDIEAGWYKVLVNLYLYDNNDLTGNSFATIRKDEKITIKKVKFRYSDFSGDSGTFNTPDLISAYVESRSGISGWISMDFNDYTDIIVDNHRSFQPM